MAVMRMFNALIFAAALTMFASGAHQAAIPSAAPLPTVPLSATLIDPQWMGLTADQPQGWEEMNRVITSEFQQFDFRPADETELRFHCNGCAPWTATLTAYAPGELDVNEARRGRPVSVNADGDGYFTENPAERKATLTWQYADRAWATVQGLTSRTAVLDRMVELARALEPEERYPVLLPISMASVPLHTPLAQLEVSRTRYGTTLTFARCGRTDVGGTPPCMTASDHLSVQIWPNGDSGHHIPAEDAVPVAIGGHDGLYNPGGASSGEQASVQVGPRMLVVFGAGGSAPSAPSHLLEDVLAGVSFAPDPANRETWPAVDEWAR